MLSSLDIQRNNAPKPVFADYRKAYAGGKVPDVNLSSSFDNFIVDFRPGQINNEHISFQERNGDWLAEELNGNNAISDCSAFCSNVSTRIEGSSSICNLGTYTLDNPNYTPTWSITSGGNLVNMVVNGNSVTIIKSNAQTTGNITLRAVIGSGNECNFETTEVTKTIFLNTKPIISFNNTALRDAILAGTSLADESPFIIESGDIINISIAGAGAPSELKWKYQVSDYGRCLTFPGGPPTNTVDGIVPLISYSFATPDPQATPLGSSTAISIPSNSYGYLEVEATTSNECGCHTETNVYVSEDTSTPPPPVVPPIDFTASPNPYTSFDFGLVINVVRIPPVPTGAQMPNDYCTFEILNLVTGFSYYQSSFWFNSNQSGLFIVPSIPPGTHVMKLSYSGETVTKLLVVQ